MSKHRQQQANQQALARANEMATSRAQLQQGAGVDEALREAAAETPAPPPPVLAVVPPPPPAPRITVTDRGVEYADPLISMGVWLHLEVTVNEAKEGIPAPGARPEQVNKIRPKKALVVHGAIVIEEMSLVLPLAGNYVRS